MGASTTTTLEANLKRVTTQFRGKRAAKALVPIATPSTTPPSLLQTLARYREAGVLTSSRKGAR